MEETIFIHALPKHWSVLEQVGICHWIVKYEAFFLDYVSVHIKSQSNYQHPSPMLRIQMGP